MIVGGVILALAGLVVIGVAIRGWQGRLPRNFVAGVRTPATMRSDEAFQIANKVAAPLAVAGGAVMVAVVLIVIGAVHGARAVRSAP